MKTRSIIKNVVYLLVIGTVVVSSCKKKDDAKPSPTVNTDNTDMGTTATATINVLANDTYSGNANVTVNANAIFGTVVVNSDKTVTYTPKTNFYGTATFTYNLQDDNGSSSGSLVIKRGTDAQIKTYTIINKYLPQGALALYAVDGDSSRIYKPGYLNSYIDYVGFSNNKLIIRTGGIMPNIGTNVYTILSDGNFSTLADDGSGAVIFTVLDEFTASAKKMNGSSYMTVNGYSIQYNTHKLDFTTQVN